MGIPNPHPPLKFERKARWGHFARNPLFTLKKIDHMKKGVILYQKPISYVRDGQTRFITVLGVMPAEGGAPIEIVANTAEVKGEAVFYKAVASGEIMYGDRVATEDTNVLIGVTTLANVKAVKATVEALATLEF